MDAAFDMPLTSAFHLISAASDGSSSLAQVPEDFTAPTSSDAAMVVSLQSVYKDVAEKQQQQKPKTRMEGLLGKPEQAFQIITAQFTTLFALSVVNAVQGVFPGDLLVLMTATWAALIMLIILPPIGRALSNHPSRKWIAGWIQFLDFVAYVALFVIIVYALAMLTQLWQSAVATVFQLLVVTVVIIEIVWVVFYEVSGRLTNHKASTRHLINTTIVFYTTRLQHRGRVHVY